MAALSRRRRKPPHPSSLDLKPLRILRSILLLQIAYYTIATILILFTTLVLGQAFSTSLVLDWHSVRGDVTWGWLVGGCWVLTSFLSVIPLLLLLHRSHLVPDFALTTHFLHLVVTTIYTHSLPTNLLWWLLQLGSAFLMISLGMWATRYREMRPMTFAIAGGTGGKKEQVANGDLGEGHIRGGTGRGRNDSGGSGGPSYEMVESGRGKGVV